METEKPKTHKITCPKCGKELHFNRDDVLHLPDVTGANPLVFTEFVRCWNVIGWREGKDGQREAIYCRHQNLLAHRDTNGKVNQYAEVTEL